MAHEGLGVSRGVSRPAGGSSPLGTQAAGTAEVPPSGPRRIAVARVGFAIDDEGARTRLIGDISSLLHEPAVPASARSAGLELIGWLARRMPGEPPHALGVEEATQAKRTARRKTR
jgi:hypothetical protein